VTYDRKLDDRVAQIVLPRAAERKSMFGGTGYMLDGHLMAGVYRERLVLRLSPQAGDAALGEPHTGLFEMTRRPMPGWITVAPEGVAGDGLQRWLERAIEHASSLPPK
jgi:TfoX/Sxy family transcriptional regulator of competence genes